MPPTLFIQSILLREVPALVNAAGDFPSLSALGVVDGSATRRYVCDALKQGGVQVHRIFHILNLEAWVRSNLS
jgi:hypothetical protein